jgi:hypothetical protein
MRGVDRRRLRSSKVETTSIAELHSRRERIAALRAG